MSSKRITILFGGISVAFCALLARLLQLQTTGDGSPAFALAEERTIVLPAARGAIFDRDSRLVRATRDAFDVHVTPATFREKNLVDALADLMVLAGPTPGGAASLGRARLVAELRGPRPEAALGRILALDANTAATSDADDLDGRARALIEPEGTLIRPSSYARRRVVDALVVVAGDRRPPARELRKRLKEQGATVAKVTGATAGTLIDRIRREDELLARLGAELGIGDADEVRSALDVWCDRHFRGVEEEVERRVDDAICLQHLGSWKLEPSKLDDEDRAKLRAGAAAVIEDRGRARAAAAAARTLLAGGLPRPLPPAGAAPDEPGAHVAAARGAGLSDWDAAAIRAAYCGRIRSEPGFDRNRYMDARKESQTRNELAAKRGYDLGFGGGFALAGIVDGPGGLRPLGFELVPSFIRDDSRRQAGANLALLLGDVNRRGKAASGLEERLEDVLRGEPGEAKVREPGQVIAHRPARHGRNVKLTLSLALQERIEAVLHRMGAVAVVDVATGGILAAATWPLPAGGDAQAALAELADLKTRRLELQVLRRNGDETAGEKLAGLMDRIVHSPGIHRAVTSETNMPPGSVMKAVTLLTGLEAGAIKPGYEVECTTGERHHFGCHEHGRVDVEGAIERSCNEYCYRTVELLGGSAQLFAMYEKIGLYDEIPGLVGPAAGAWQRRAIQNDDPKNLAIGQGSFSLPPVRLAALAASLASGRVVRAHLFAPEGFEAVGGPFASEHNLDVIRSGMRRVAVGAHGTAARHYRRQLEPLGIAGKTGTAQIRSGDEDFHQAWFVGWAPHVAPRYAFAVLIERTSEEGVEASPIAARVIEACYDVLGGRP